MPTVVPRHLPDSERQPSSVGQGGGVVVNYRLFVSVRKAKLERRLLPGTAAAANTEARRDDHQLFFFFSFFFVFD